MAAGNPSRYELGMRGRTPLSAIASLRQLAAGQPILTCTCGAAELLGKGLKTEGGEAWALIIQLSRQPQTLISSPAVSETSGKLRPVVSASSSDRVSTEG
jgi:hypothetical protein